MGVHFHFLYSCAHVPLSELFPAGGSFTPFPLFPHCLARAHSRFCRITGGIDFSTLSLPLSSSSAASPPPPPDDDELELGRAAHTPIENYRARRWRPQNATASLSLLAPALKASVLLRCQKKKLFFFLHNAHGYFFSSYSFILYSLSLEKCPQCWGFSFHSYSRRKQSKANRERAYLHNIRRNFCCARRAFARFIIEKFWNFG